MKNTATPPQGWNSWDAYGTNIREDEFLANAGAMAELLSPSGYTHVVVDHQWYDPNAAPGPYIGDWRCFAMDGQGRLLPDPARFPRSRGGRGFAPMASAVHDLGLSFGLHCMRGVPRLAVEHACPIPGTPHTCADIADRDSVCVWNSDMWGLNMDHPAAQPYLNSVFRQFADWGVDFVKMDDMMNDPFHAAEIRGAREAIRASGRPMLLSLSPGGGGETWMAAQLQRDADMWRISGDLWDDWKTVRRMFDLCAIWCWHQTDGHWPDCDMLPLGRIGIRAQHGPDRPTRLTRDEQTTLMTLWCVFRSPLMIGGDLPSLREDPWTLGLLTHPGLLEAFREGRSPRVLAWKGEVVVWTSTRRDGDSHIALFNLGETPVDLVTFALPPTALNLTRPGEALPARLRPHASLLLRTNTPFSETAEGQGVCFAQVADSSRAINPRSPPQK